jgi:hypothetical protein
MISEFIWSLHESGHAVVALKSIALKGSEIVSGDTAISDDQWIVPVNRIRRHRRYAPLRTHTALFRTFVDLDPSPESIVNFADRFGLLTDPDKGEPLATWRSAIADMRPAVESWETNLISAPHQGMGKPVVDESGKALGTFQVTSAVFGGRGHRDNVLFELGCLIGQKISNVRPVFNYDELLDGFRLRFMPSNLLEAMWLQFGQAVESNKSFRKCRGCGTWFELSPKTARTDKVFCTEACKAKAYRRRLAKQDRGGSDLQPAIRDAPEENHEDG